MQTAYVSFPPGSTITNAEKWEAALRARIPAGRSVIVIVDEIGGQYRIRSAHSVDGSGIGDLTPDATRILHEAGLV
jgi:hypothetical protein